MNRAVVQRSHDQRDAAASSSARSGLTDAIFALLRSLRHWNHFIRSSVHALLKPRAPIEDVGPTPARYEDLASALRLEDRPMPLTKFEQAVPGEATLIGRMARLAAHAVVENYCEMKSTNATACAMRDQHAKTNGCVDADFVVRDDLPAEFTTSLFRPGARYPALVRFSNGQGKPQGDRKVDARGLAIKLHDVGGTTFLREILPDKVPPGEHDFLFSSFPVFFCKDTIEYTEFMDAVSAKSGTRREKLIRLWRWFWFIIRHPGQFIKFIRTGLIKVTNPLTATYHSMSPFLFGEDKVVRYLVGPAQPPAPAPWWKFFSWPKAENFLRDALAHDLDPAVAGGDVVLDFSVRVRHSATPQDVEDASLWWTRPVDKTVCLAKIRIPRQAFEAPDRRYDTEHMMFSPWNSLPEHRPLGSINRMRLAVYLGSLQVRRKLNMVGS